MRPRTFPSGLITDDHNYKDPYIGLAVNILARAAADLQALGEREHGIIGGCTVDKWEIVAFSRSKWCELLISFQNDLTHEDIKAVFDRMAFGE